MASEESEEKAPDVAVDVEAGAPPASVAQASASGASAGSDGVSSPADVEAVGNGTTVTDGAAAATDPSKVVTTGRYGFDESDVADIDHAHRVKLEWNDISFSVKGGAKKILHNVSGSIRPGELCAIMGPSGAGKSTLLNIIAGRIRGGGGKSVSGTLSANGKKVDPMVFRKRIAYVMQEDALFATQTPREAFDFSAHLRLPASTTAEEREKVVKRTLTALGLDKAADTLIGNAMIPGISGGEKKRTAIGQELISNPSVLALDEPTSGLDSYAAFQVVKILKRLSNSGRTIMTTIHQPSSEVFDLFDRVVLLAEGRLIYNGPTDTLTEYFAALGHPCKANYNPSDHVMFVMQQQDHDGVVEMEKKFIEAEAKRDDGSEGDDVSDVDFDKDLPEARKRVGFCTQFGLLGFREFNNVVRDKGAMFGRIFVTFFLNLIVGLVFESAADWSETGSDPGTVFSKVNSHFGGIVQVAIGGMFGLAQPTLLSFPQERVVFLREYAAGQYSATAYFLSKMIAEVPLTIMTSTVIFLCTYWLLGFSAPFMELTLVVALLGMVASSTSLIIGAMASDVNTALQMTPLLFVPQILFAGFFIPISSIPVWLRWAQYLCSLKYSINVLLVAEFYKDDHMPPESWYDGNPSEQDVAIFQNSMYGCAGDDILADGTCVGDANDSALFPRSDVVPGDIWIYIGILAAVLVAFRTLALAVLVKKARA